MKQALSTEFQQADNSGLKCLNCSTDIMVLITSDYSNKTRNL